LVGELDGVEEGIVVGEEIGCALGDVDGSEEGDILGVMVGVLLGL
jgi:hypothetical protein